MDLEAKIKSRAQLARLIPALKRAGRRIGLTNGVFDLLHWGHAAYLAEARALCDVLIVSCNTDASVRRYKGDARPLVPLRERQRLVAALQAVSFVTSHGERRMRRTLEALKPDLYIKGGDYDAKALTSRAVVEAYGGKAVVLSLAAGRSTTALINRAAEAAFREGRFLPGPAAPRKPAAFLDRDGVILAPVPHLHEPEKAALMPGAAAGLRLLARRGLRLIVVTNQPGIGMGYFTLEDFFRVNSRMLGLLAKEGVMIDAVYFCPHSPALACGCRKPATGLFARALAEQPILRRGSLMFGDREADMRAARRFRVPGVLVGPGDTAAARRLAAARGRDLLAAARLGLTLRRTVG
ncbi:MAG TPA: HAD-IIIA family hydrolase [Planctomycetota bacterium]|jgi:D-beta-D-heptose 7-phosphate kinase/D-beta-D-heptose 1-phosphate adenosyltransferase|nr:HAD-IIIA family hydrolase [Planctomycetota bacterium]OQC22096.1 MAG: Bifunctional protein HldE [Planctomycetes bacterium ADurb.Bin069]HNR98021.1 HAD-IIIA family hydrolase [Planctomycetota bacterium]HNU25770.1 HAD-IIIA family hydrolase [Planctomycetota bacterium]HOE28676.1 HAD-IIIA family hydrolase [Planctomycetota bacterium]